MTISILTLFPQMFDSVFQYSIMKRAEKQGIVSIDVVDIRDFAKDAYKTVDDKPYGGGTGMILKVDVLDRALASVKSKVSKVSSVSKASKQAYTVLLTPQGIPYKQDIAKKLSHKGHLILVCGHYEGFDERIRDLVDMEISVGDYILTGGEIPAMILTDTVTRLQPGIFTKKDVTENESFEKKGLLEYPQYTKPAIYKGKKVPDILLSGNHAKINEWKETEAVKRTERKRPDLLSS